MEGPASHHSSLKVRSERSEVRGQSTSSQVKFAALSTVILSTSVSSTVGSISAEPGTCFSHSIAYIKYVYMPSALALFPGSPLTLTKSKNFNEAKGKPRNKATA